MANLFGTASWPRIAHIWGVRFQSHHYSHGRIISRPGKLRRRGPGMKSSGSQPSLAAPWRGRPSGAFSVPIDSERGSNSLGGCIFLTRNPATSLENSLMHRSKWRLLPEFGKIDAQQKIRALAHEPRECVSALIRRRKEMERSSAFGGAYGAPKHGLAFPKKHERYDCDGDWQVTARPKCIAASAEPAAWFRDRRGRDAASARKADPASGCARFSRRA
jgi:hypothetical protein